MSEQHTATSLEEIIHKNILISDKYLRRAIYDVFGGRCFYSGRELTLKNMSIDHIHPRSKGGDNCIANYVLCDRDINTGKNNKKLHNVDATLSLVRTMYTDKVGRLYLKLKNQSSKVRVQKPPRTFKDDIMWSSVNKSCPSVVITFGHECCCTFNFHAVPLSTQNYWRRISDIIAAMYDPSLGGRFPTTSCRDILDFSLFSYIMRTPTYHGFNGLLASGSTWNNELGVGRLLSSGEQIPSPLTYQCLYRAVVLMRNACVSGNQQSRVLHGDLDLPAARVQELQLEDTNWGRLRKAA